MPVLARTLESAGLSTVMISQMPYWAERMGAPRALAVAFPFGHTLGRPGNREMQTRVIRQALQVLEGAKEPGAIQHSPQTWPEPVKSAIQDWQPAQPSPVIREMIPHLRQMIRDQKRER